MSAVLIAVAIFVAAVVVWLALQTSQSQKRSTQLESHLTEPVSYTHLDVYKRQPFSDMDANYSNGNSIYNAFSANLRKRFNNHYQFLASYTLSHAIDDATDLEATLTPVSYTHL